jgi:dihydropteroate synthase
MRKLPLLMGVINVTPDSFSDGGKYFSLATAFAQAERLVNEGADILDVGGESSRPGADPVSVSEERDRVIPLIDEIHRRLGVPLSIDTTKFEVALEAFRHGATILNDISGGSDLRIVPLLAESKGTLILMHRQGAPQTMQRNPSYPRGVVTEISDFLKERVALFERAGIPREKIWVDPGIGFGKTIDHNLELLKHLHEFTEIGGRLIIGTSRKTFLSGILGSSPAPFPDRVAGTIASNLWAYEHGASVFRVHDVGEFRRALTTWERMANAG